MKIRNIIIRIIIYVGMSIIWGLFHIINYPNISLLNFIIMCLEFLGFILITSGIEKLLLNK